MSRILVNPNTAKLGEFVTFAEENSVGFEVLAFCNPLELDDEEALRKNIEMFMPFRDKIESLHGAFIGLQVACDDEAIRNVSRKRIEQSCEIAKELGIKSMVVHCDKLPYVLYPDYTDYWVEGSYAFYAGLLERYDVNILMENCWDLGPQPLKQLIRRMNTERFKACMDTGHVNCFSRAGLEEWVDVLNTDLAQLHINDNGGELDEHKPAGEGTFDFKALTAKLKEYTVRPRVVFEMNVYEEIDNIEKSMAYLKANGLYPFDAGEDV